MTDVPRFSRRWPDDLSPEILTVDIEEVDTSCAQEFTAALLGSDLSVPVVVDLERVTFIDTTGLECLVVVTRRRREAGGELVIANCTRTVNRLLQITGMHQIISAYPDVELARAALASGRTTPAPPYLYDI